MHGFNSPFQGNNISLVQKLNKDRANSVRQIVNMISVNNTYASYRAFATNARTGGGPSGSLEALHNSYHNMIGDGGHMSDVAVAAFDPIFWMHHAYVISTTLLSCPY